MAGVFRRKKVEKKSKLENILMHFFTIRVRFRTIFSVFFVPRLIHILFIKIFDFVNLQTFPFFNLKSAHFP